MLLQVWMHRIFILYTGSCSDLYYVANIREKNKVSFNYVNLLYSFFLYISNQLFQCIVSSAQWFLFCILIIVQAYL